MESKGINRRNFTLMRGTYRLTHPVGGTFNYNNNIDDLDTEQHLKYDFLIP